MAEYKNISSALQVAFDAAKEMEEEEALARGIVWIMMEYPKVAIEILNYSKMFVEHVPIEQNTNGIGIFHIRNLSNVWICYYIANKNNTYTLHYDVGSKRGKTKTFDNLFLLYYECQIYLQNEGYFCLWLFNEKFNR